MQILVILKKLLFSTGRRCNFPLDTKEGAGV
jgi:hypothetical protein